MNIAQAFLKTCPLSFWMKEMTFLYIFSINRSRFNKALWSPYIMWFKIITLPRIERRQEWWIIGNL